MTSSSTTFASFIIKQLLYNTSMRYRYVITAKDSVHLLLRALNPDADIMVTWAHNNSVGMTQQVKAVLEERWFERHKALELVQINRSLKQLPVWVVWEMCEDKL